VLTGQRIDKQQERDVELPYIIKASKSCSSYISQFDRIDAAILNQHVPYDPLAQGRVGDNYYGYNSNSYVRTLLADSGLSVPSLRQNQDGEYLTDAPGYDKLRACPQTPQLPGLVFDPTGTTSVVAGATGGRARHPRAVAHPQERRGGGCGASGDRWWTQDRVWMAPTDPGIDQNVRGTGGRFVDTLSYPYEGLAVIDNIY